MFICLFHHLLCDVEQVKITNLEFPISRQKVTVIYLYNSISLSLDDCSEYGQYQTLKLRQELNMPIFISLFQHSQALKTIAQLTFCLLYLDFSSSHCVDHSLSHSLVSTLLLS